MGGIVTCHTLSGIEYQVVDFNGRTSLHIPLGQPSVADRERGDVLREVQDHFLSTERERFDEHTALSFSDPDVVKLLDEKFVCVDL